MATTSSQRKRPRGARANCTLQRLGYGDPADEWSASVRFTQPGKPPNTYAAVFPSEGAAEDWVHSVVANWDWYGEARDHAVARSWEKSPQGGVEVDYDRP